MTLPDLMKIPFFSNLLKMPAALEFLPQSAMGKRRFTHPKELKSNSQGRVARQNSFASKSPLFSASEQP
jgi:hypothetical protein